MVPDTPPQAIPGPNETTAIAVVTVGITAGLRSSPASSLCVPGLLSARAGVSVWGWPRGGAAGGRQGTGACLLGPAGVSVNVHVNPQQLRDVEVTLVRRAMPGVAASVPSQEGTALASISPRHSHHPLQGTLYRLAVQPPFSLLTAPASTNLLWGGATVSEIWGVEAGDRRITEPEGPLSSTGHGETGASPGRPGRPRAGGGGLCASRTSALSHV